ncbi:zinc finger BED domain-containing protein RICESLEEPER 2-like [Arachis duranensis]|uniref:Zinc finger BED domain-containing protein RICESLEEPER 2-like n=1 Tax=Arachis duranensis TaxID=130453 RepID=A0A6P5M816_ARADU|nr:zinc finger BED domain-containing protein RICESLEEPER 2-like [Arachis duranensis]
MDDEIISETPVQASGSVDSGKKSNVWRFFKKIKKDRDGIEKAECNFCHHEYKIEKNPKTKNAYGTSHLSRHIVSCKSIPLNIRFDDDIEGLPTKIDQNVHRKKLAQAIAKHDFAFSFVEYESIRDWINYISPTIIMPSRNTLVSDLQMIYSTEKEKLRQKMSRIPNRICLTSDVWTASTTEGYICLTAHFVDENWRLVSKILNFCRMITPHTGTNMEAVLFNSLKQWGIDKKVFSITLDNASANDNMQNILKTHLCKKNSLLCDGEYFHVRCFAHILNLIVQEGLKMAAGALFKIRESVKYVKASDGRKMKFKDCVQQTEIEEGVSPKLDVPTR